VEVRIGVQHSTRELTLDSAQSAEDIAAAVEASLSGKGATLHLRDERGRSVIVPSAALAYVEIGEGAGRKVGFGAS
jgi:hypothetical protein